MPDLDEVVPVLFTACPNCGRTHEVRVPRRDVLDVAVMRHTQRAACPTARWEDTR